MSFYKVKKASDLRKMSSEQLKKRLQDANESLMMMRSMKVAQGSLNPGQYKNMKKEKARILTILGERKNPDGFRRK
jgi:ribosomal protein L29